jgi:predicted metal-dependent phosphoesterase TrpH
VARQDKMTDQVREPQFPPRRAAGRGRGWYRGDCHVNSARSHGGELTPEQLAAAARASGLDFIAITEHNTADTHGAWGQLAGDDLLVILGQEAATLTGHWLALGIGPGQVVEWRYGAARRHPRRAVAARDRQQRHPPGRSDRHPADRRVGR